MKKRRIPEEVNLLILEGVSKEMSMTKIRCFAGVILKRLNKGLTELEEQGLINIKEEEIFPRSGPGRRLLSKTPKIYKRRVVKITEKGKSTLKKHQVNRNRSVIPTFLLFRFYFLNRFT